MAWYFGAQEQVSITDFLSGVLRAEEKRRLTKAPLLVPTIYHRFQSGLQLSLGDYLNLPRV